MLLESNDTRWGGTTVICVHEVRSWPLADKREFSRNVCLSG